jgi:hypothetical protein
VLRALWVLVGLGLAAGGILVALFSVFLLLYRGDTPDGDPYVEISGREFDAQLIGAAGLAVAVGMFLVAWLAIRRRPT